MFLLLIEDDLAQLQALKFLLETLGHRVEATTDLASGSQRLGQTKFDAVVTDYSLPDGNPKHLIQQGLLDTERTIVVSGDPRAEEMKGRVAYLFRKPLSMGRLEEALGVLRAAKGER